MGDGDGASEPKKNKVEADKKSHTALLVLTGRCEAGILSTTQ